jgi:hypothetical protein
MAATTTDWTGRMMKTLIGRTYRADRYSDDYLGRCATALAYLIARNRRSVPADLRWW